MLNQTGELQRLRKGTVGLDVPTAVERLMARTEPDRARTAFNQIREVLGIVLSVHSVGDWPSDSGWSAMLPSWFVARCAEPESDADAEKWLAWWRGLSAEEQVTAEAVKPWTVANWTYWMHPDQRRWAWWDGEVVSDHEILVLVDSPDWPTPTGALEWLLRSAGCVDVKFA